MNRLEYIGSKYKLLEWIVPEIVGDRETTVKFADLFGGTGIVSHTVSRTHPNITNIVSNDSEPYSSVIIHAMIQSVFTTKCKEFIENINKDTIPSIITYPTPITTYYSPKGTDGRMFFTESNASRIDYVRNKIEEYQDSFTKDEYLFLIASLLTSADKVSNTTSVYGAYLKHFKKRAQDEFMMLPIHKETRIPTYKASVFNKDVMDETLLDNVSEFDIVYLDPPYNSRQYSKNYFPLNIIVKGCISGEQIHGKTGIPDDCFVSDFCKKGKALDTFKRLFKELVKRGVKKIIMSYNSESIVSKENIISAMGSSGMNSVQCKSKEYSRYKSSRIEGQVKTVEEYLFIGSI